MCVCRGERVNGDGGGLGTEIKREHSDGRVYTAPNIDPERKHLNRSLVKIEGIGGNAIKAAIDRRIEEAGVSRKITGDQTRAFVMYLSGSHEQMKLIEEQGQLDEWVEDSYQWLKDQFGEENIVALELHRDEFTPHLHAVVVPITTEARVRKKREEGRKRYNIKPKVRLCVDHYFRPKTMKGWQDSYAQRMAKYGLERGVEGSKARHQSMNEYYRNLHKIKIPEAEKKLKEAAAELAAIKAELAGVSVTKARINSAYRWLTGKADKERDAAVKDAKEANKALRRERNKKRAAIDERQRADERAIAASEAKEMAEKRAERAEKAQKRERKKKEAALQERNKALKTAEMAEEAAEVKVAKRMAELEQREASLHEERSRLSEEQGKLNSAQDKARENARWVKEHRHEVEEELPRLRNEAIEGLKAIETLKAYDELEGYGITCDQTRAFMKEDDKKINNLRLGIGGLLNFARYLNKFGIVGEAIIKLINGRHRPETLKGEDAMASSLKNPETGDVYSVEGGKGIGVRLLRPNGGKDYVLYALEHCGDWLPIKKWLEIAAKGARYVTNGISNKFTNRRSMTR